MTPPAGTSSGPPDPPPEPPRGARSVLLRAWTQARDQLRSARTTEPGRLRLIGAALVVLIVAFGTLSAGEISARSDAAGDVVHHTQPLSADAADIYRSLADADTAAASGFLAGAQDPPEVRERYRDDIGTASRLLVKAATNTNSSSESGRQIAALNEGLPRYTGLIERARANNRQGLPLGGAYLRYANQQMTKELLPAAEKLYQAETGRLSQDNDAARMWPLASLALGVLTLGGLFWTQRRDYHRTNRILNHGLLGATVAATAVLLWLAVGHAVARADLGDAAHGQKSLAVLNNARINSLKARANENLTMVSRGAVLTEDGRTDKYEADFARSMSNLASALDEAKALAHDDVSREPVDTAISAVARWKKLHTSAGDAANNGDYKGALDRIIGESETTGQSFDQVDAALKTALGHEQAEFTRSASAGGNALTGLAAGAGVLALAGAAGILLGIGRRLSEYR
ncbi:hypothetical protein [Streptomyces sp. NPDC088725]|uniref:hypothetical protein n=1 Tax=Streptomyces sp. NPDC088725 TaxID=3365873 RepID=UPI003817C8E8